MLRIVTVIGARPQFVKSAACSRAFARSGRVDEVLVHTGQHYDAQLSQVFFDELRIPAPRHRLDVGSGAHGEQTGAMLAAVERVLLDERPDVVLVYGDTNSTLAGALAAAKLHVPVAHVEAGLRSFNRRMPEEVNRVLTDHVSEWLFAPSDVAVANLAREGITGPGVQQVGDVMRDATELFGALPERPDGARTQLGLDDGYLLATIHRAENTDDPARLEAIVGALVAAAAERPVVLPLHPRTRGRLEAAGSLEDLARHVRLLEPVGYLDMLALVRGAAAVVTDSGGLQKEAYFLGRPCVTVRSETEWVELVEAGWNVLADPGDRDAMVAAIAAAPGRTGAPAPLYGDGRTAERILEALAGAGS